MLFVLRRNNIGPDLGPGTKPGQKPGQKPSAAQFARPLRGAEVLVAVRGPSHGEGGGKKKECVRKIKVCEVKPPIDSV